MNVEEAVAEARRLRDLIGNLEEQIKPLKADLEKVKGLILSHLNETGSSAIKTAAGSCYISVKWSATIADGSAFQEFVKGNNAFDLIDWKANAPAVREYAEKTGGLPPGVNLSSFQTLGVRKP
jgi:hypothetical protein